MDYSLKVLVDVVSRALHHGQISSDTLCWFTLWTSTAAFGEVYRTLDRWLIELIPFFLVRLDLFVNSLVLRLIF